MKVAFVGKGGSGKTTLSALLTLYISSFSKIVHSIDADINQHLGSVLGIQGNVREMGNEIQRIKEYINPSQELVSHSQMIKTTPPNSQSQFIVLNQANDLVAYFARQKGTIALYNIGQFCESDIGTKCFHSKTGALELFVNHLIDGKNDYLICDMTAGADAFASGLFTRFDMTVVVVEPTIKSLDVYFQYKKYAQKFGVMIKVVGNKIFDEKDEAFLLAQIEKRDYLGGLTFSHEIKEVERGGELTVNIFKNSNIEFLCRKIKEILDDQKKDWNKYYSDMLYFHKKNGESWANATLGIDVAVQIDEYFDYESKVKSFNID